MKRTRASGLVLAGAAGLAGLGVGVVLVPAAATAATSSTSAPAAVADRVTSIKDALAGLVSDGTLTQAQADKVATTLDEKLPKHGFGRGGVDLATAASVIGVTEDELRTALEGGATLAQVAEGKGVSQATLVEKLVADRKTRIAEAVKAGTITQAQADEKIAGLQERITERVTSTRPMGGRHGGPGGGDGTRPPAPAPSPSASSTS
jgi:hypothetical protein